MLPALVAVAMAPQQINLTNGLVITRSVKVRGTTFNRPGGDETSGKAVVTVRGNGITVDFAGATLLGSAMTAEPDTRKGLGLRVEGSNVTIKNLRVRGYMVGIMARNCPRLKLIDCDVSYNWKQHLMSDQDKEDLSDWMSYHHNEKDEWLRYGAGIYLRGCKNFEVRGCKAEGGQCGLMMTECDKGLIWNNDFSFLSGIGLGMYHCSDNRIMHNKIDWCVRGFSYGKYNRGQDSAGILIYEQSNRNVFAYNSVTHGGDGFFLWAGQTTMDTGQGGCNDNLLYGNDFSHAPTNGIEATFSRNNFINNLVLECWHGVWGGYGYESKVSGNVFGYNVDAIAWEHGQDNLVKGNIFYRDETVLRIWANKSQDPNWGFAKKRDTRSRDWLVEGNTFSEIPGTILSLNRTTNFTLGENRYGPARGFFDLRGPILNFRSAEAKSRARKAVSTSTGPTGTTTQTSQEEATVGPLTMNASAEDAHNVSNFLTDPLPDISPLARKGYIDSREFSTNWNPLHKGAMPPISIGTLAAGSHLASVPREALAFALAPLKGGADPFLKPGALRGWRYMIVDEWGPYDFKRPLLWPREDLNPGVTGRYTRKRFEILGPKGTWKVVSMTKGVILSKESGQVPGEVEVTLPAGQASNVKIELQYMGGATTDYRGIVTPAGKPVRFGYSKFFAPIDWTIRFYKWSKAESAQEHANPSEPEVQAILKGAALKELKSDKLDFAGSSFDPVTGNDHFLTVGEGTFTVQPGDYTLELTTDDGARLWLDGKPLIEDAWHYQGPTLYSRNVRLDAGSHRLRVEHFQIDGYAALKVNLRPRKP